MSVFQEASSTVFAKLADAAMLPVTPSMTPTVSVTPTSTPPITPSVTCTVTPSLSPTATPQPNAAFKTYIQVGYVDGDAGNYHYFCRIRYTDGDGYFHSSEYYSFYVANHGGAVEGYTFYGLLYGVPYYQKNEPICAKNIQSIAGNVSWTTTDQICGGLYVTPTPYTSPTSTTTCTPTVSITPTVSTSPHPTGSWGYCMFPILGFIGHSTGGYVPGDNYYWRVWIEGTSATGQSGGWTLETGLCRYDIVLPATMYPNFSYAGHAYDAGSNTFIRNDSICWKSVNNTSVGSYIMSQDYCTV